MLISAAEQGNAGRVRELLDAGASVRARDRGGRTALTAAAYGNHLEAARALVAAGADVNAKDATTQSPYLIATSEVGDDPRLLELMLANGAKVDDKDSYNGTGLIRAAERGHARIVRRLLRAGIDRDHGGVDVNLPDADGVSPLEHAEERGYRGIARLLRQAGARR